MVSEVSVNDACAELEANNSAQFSALLPAAPPGRNWVGSNMVQGDFSLENHQFGAFDGNADARNDIWRAKSFKVAPGIRPLCLSPPINSPRHLDKAE
ncbi:hypothetical protein VTO42DRAFT_259 [Malbranchea cinnamomea]